MTLTLEERRYIAKKVIKSNRKTISEAKNNSRIKEQVKLNLEFYNGLKETILSEKKVLKESVIMGLYTIFGTLKTILTAIGLTALFLEGMRRFFNKFIGPTWFGKKVNEWVEKGKDMCHKLEDILGPKGIAYIIAFFKYKGKITKENVEKEIELGKKVMIAVLIVLICLALVAVWSFVGPALMTSFSSSAPLNAFWSICQGNAMSAGSAAFSAIGIPMKAVEIKHYSSKTGHEIHEEGLEDEIKKEVDSIYELSKDNLEKVLGPNADEKPPKENEIPDDVLDAMKAGKEETSESRKFKLKSISESTLRKNKMKQNRRFK